MSRKNHRHRHRHRNRNEMLKPKPFIANSMNLELDEMFLLLEVLDFVTDPECKWEPKADEHGAGLYNLWHKFRNATETAFERLEAEGMISEDEKDAALANGTDVSKV